MKKNIHTGKLFLVFLISLAGLAACTTMPPQLPAQTSQPEPAYYDAIDYYSWVIGAAPEQMREEQTRLEDQTTVAGEEHSLVQLAVLISAKTSDSEQDKRALDLLDQFEQYQTGTIQSDYRALAHLWRQALEPRMQSRQLREQIEALTTIERQLDRREQQGG